MTDTKKLELLADYQFLCYSVTAMMLHAYEFYNEGDEDRSWSALLAWCEAKDKREQAWVKVMWAYVEAMNMKEGVK